MIIKSESINDSIISRGKGDLALIYGDCAAFGEREVRVCSNSMVWNRGNGEGDRPWFWRQTVLGLDGLVGSEGFI